MKLCKDCKYHYIDYTVDFCGRKAVIENNLVRGGYRIHGEVRAEEERRSLRGPETFIEDLAFVFFGIRRFYDESRCGVTGKHFEPKGAGNDYKQ